MTFKQLELVHKLRETLYNLNYPPIYVVDIETLEAVETDILEVYSKQEKPEILIIGPNNGILFKGVELVIKK